MKLIRPPQEVKGPTPETKSKAVEGAVGLLAKRKFLWPEHCNAAFLIEDAHNLINDDVGWSLMRYDDLGRDTSRPPTQDLSTALRRVVHQYNDWVDELTARNKRRYYAMTLDIVVEGRFLKNIERRYGLDGGAAKYMLRDSLDLYCCVAGWPSMRSGLDRAMEMPHKPARGSVS